MKTQSIFGNVISWLFGTLVLVIGIINTIWGNDLGFGIFLLLLAFAYFPPATQFLQLKFGLRVPLFAKVLLGVFIIWAAMGVGELFDKVDLMLADLRN